MGEARVTSFPQIHKIEVLISKVRAKGAEKKGGPASGTQQVEVDGKDTVMTRAQHWTKHLMKESCYKVEPLEDSAVIIEIIAK